MTNGTSGKPLVYVVDDEPSILDSVSVLLQRRLGYRVRTFETLPQVIEALGDVRPDLLLSDIMIDGQEAGVEILRRARQMWPDLPVVLMSAVGSREAAIAAVNEGAFYFLEKPFENAFLSNLVKSGVEASITRTHARESAEQTRKGRRGEATGSGRGLRLVGESEAFLETLALVEQAALSEATVLLEGPSGVGKGVFAGHLHQVSNRASGPFLSINCGALTETLLESQLFGHLKGAFTGADKDQPGLVRAAEGGTLFLDEVSELSPATQVKLLRVLQEREVIPVGGTQSHEVNVRFVAASNRDLRKDVASGRFREDLFWRLNVMAIRIPSLRERKEDIPLLAAHTLDRLRQRDSGIRAQRISEDAIRALSSHSWPGNVRELENAIERAAVVAGEIIRISDLPPDVRHTPAPESSSKEPGSLLQALNSAVPTLIAVEHAYVSWIVAREGGDIPRAAHLLGIPEVAVRAILAADPA